MRFLCLHGHGTSASIFKSQTAAFRAKLDESFEFDFVDAPFRSTPAPGIDALFPNSDYYTWWPKPNAQSIRAAHLWVDDYIAEHGPYDAVCCFSQGCSLIGSYLLYHAKENPEAPLPFKAAVFICGGMPFIALEDLGLPISQRAHDLNGRTSAMLQQKAGALKNFSTNLNKIQPGVGLWDDTMDLVHNPDTRPDLTDVFGLDFTEFPENIRINIPTVNIYGCKDPRWPASMQLAYFCNKKRMYDHRGGHDVPRTTEVSNRIAQLVRDLTADAAQGHR